MKRSVLKGIFFAVVLFVALIVFETMMNQGNTDMTAEMSKATYPLMQMRVSGETVNCLHGYQSTMDVAYMRDTITPLENHRNLGIIVEKFDSDIKELSYEVRSSDGSRLIEDTQITDYSETDESIVAYFTIKDLIEPKQEYNLSINVTLQSGQKVYYFTRIVLVEDYHVAEKIAFVKKMHEDTFDKANASENLAKYMEPNSLGDNTTLQKVDIHSSLDQITWGNLTVRKLTEPDVDIKEMMELTASFKLEYRVEAFVVDTWKEHLVTEYYRIRYTPDRVYLLDFERQMHQLFDEKARVYNGNTIFLGIQNQEELELLECDGGGIFAFVIGDRLFSYNEADNKMALLFSFYDENNNDDRTIYDGHDIRILNVDETGNVQFVVYGYMNRGRHEGTCGVQVNYYNSSRNTIEEQIFISYDKSPQILCQEMGQLCYAGNANTFYLLMNSSIYEIDLVDKTCKVIQNNLKENSFKVSDDGHMVAYALGETEYRAEKLVLMNMVNGKTSTISAGYNEYVMPLGFMDDDLIYGMARKDHIQKDSAGRIFFPMHKIRIENENNQILKEYEQPDVYVTDCIVQENQITLLRVQKDEETGEYQVITNDQIMNSAEEDVGKNTIKSVVIDVLETVVQLETKSEIDFESLQCLTPKEVLFECENKLYMEESADKTESFYMYTTHGLEGIYADASTAVNRAYEKAGVVMNDAGKCVWYKGNRVTRNQIMKITGEQITDQMSQLAVCLNTMMSFEGVNRNSQYMLDNGKTTIEILQQNIPDIQVLDLTGCSLDAILHYTNQDIPVLVTLEEDVAMLVIGFNELNVVVMDPERGEVYKIGMNDATKRFEENGNCFITYMRNGQ